MHKTETLDYGIVLSGERELILDDGTLVMKPGDCVVQVGTWHQWSFVLVLDTQEVKMKAGEIAILRGANHAWSNRSGKPATVAISSHDGRE